MSIKIWIITKHLSLEERYLIDFLINNQKLSISEMAKKLSKNRSTIFRELKRNLNNYGFYSHDKAHKKYIKKKSNCHMFCMFKYKNFTELFLSKYNEKSFWDWSNNQSNKY